MRLRDKDEALLALQAEASHEHDAVRALRDAVRPPRSTQTCSGWRLPPRSRSRRFRPARIYTAVLGSSTPLPMSYPYLHVHVIPVMESDERARPARVFSCSEGVIVYDEPDALGLAAELRLHWPPEPDR